ncbi:hypothetical protein [Methylomagnum sp.]
MEQPCFFFGLMALWLKALSFSGGAAILIGEFVALSEFFEITKENRSAVFVAFLFSWLVSFMVALPVMLKILKRQESRYKIHAWEILLGDKKAIDDYYSLKREEIKKVIEDELDLAKLNKEKVFLEKERTKIEEEKNRLLLLQEGIDEILDKKQHIIIPVSFKYQIDRHFFEVLPRYIQSVSQFNHHVTSLTDDYVNSITLKLKQSNSATILRSYLLALNYYIGQLLFEWRDVRVHFRKLNTKTQQYEKYVANYRTGEEYKEPLTPIPANDGLISEAAKLKRSLVYSANKDISFNTGSSHIWKDYITIEMFPNYHKYIVHNCYFKAVRVKSSNISLNLSLMALLR